MFKINKQTKKQSNILWVLHENLGNYTVPCPCPPGSTFYDRKADQSLNLIVHNGRASFSKLVLFWFTPFPGFEGQHD